MTPSPSISFPGALSRIFQENPQSIQSCGGGDAADAYRVGFADGRELFVKKARRGTPFRMEALGLQKMLQVSDGVRVPEVLHVDDHMMALEFLEFGSPGPRYEEVFGQQLAATHRERHTAFGFQEDHAIGLSPQLNQPWVPLCPGAWRSFWWTHRLEPMIRALPSPVLQKQAAGLESRLQNWIPDEAGPPSLLHGDLWSGNTAADTQGLPVMFDPAPYYGYREAELGMTQLFGGFSDTFYQAYHEAWPLPDGWRDRMNFYMFYHVLNHAVLFEGSYLHQAQRILHELL